VIEYLARLRYWWSEPVVTERNNVILRHVFGIMLIISLLQRVVQALVN